MSGVFNVYASIILGKAHCTFRLQILYNLTKWYYPYHTTKATWEWSQTSSSFIWQLSGDTAMSVLRNIDDSELAGGNVVVEALYVVKDSGKTTISHEGIDDLLQEEEMILPLPHHTTASPLTGCDWTSDVISSDVWPWSPSPPAPWRSTMRRPRPRCRASRSACRAAS